MRKNLVKISVILVILTTFSNFIFNASAEPAQWFPQTGTRIEHEMSSYTHYTNGTRDISDKFNIFTYSEYIVIMPVALDEAMVDNIAYDRVMNNTEVSVIHSYTEGSPTEFNRTTTFIINNTEYNDKTVWWARYTTNLSANNHVFHAESVLVNKLDFLTSITHDFLDYFDKSAAPGTEIVPFHNLLAVTNDQIIILDTFGSDSLNLTHIADRTGKVHTFIFSETNFIALSCGIQSHSYVLSSGGSSSSIPSFQPVFILLSVGLAIIILVKRPKIFTRIKN